MYTTFRGLIVIIIIPLAVGDDGISGEIVMKQLHNLSTILKANRRSV